MTDKPNPLSMDGDREKAHTRYGLAHRCDMLRLDEELILKALTDAHKRGEIPHVFFSPAYDVTATRAAALSWQAAALRRADSIGQTLDFGTPEGSRP